MQLCGLLGVLCFKISDMSSVQIIEQGYRTRLIKIATFLGGLYFFLEFILPDRIGPYQFGMYHEQISRGFIAMSAIAFGLGLFNLISSHGSRIVFLRKGALYSAALLLGLVVMLWLSISDWVGSSAASRQGAKFKQLSDFAVRIESDHKNRTWGVKDLPERRELLLNAVKNELTLLSPDLVMSEQFQSWSTQYAEISKLEAEPTEYLAQLPILANSLSDLGTVVTQHGLAQHQASFGKKMMGVFFSGLFNSLGAAMFSLLGFYIVSAAYRAFRIKSLESGLMMAAALVVMLGQISFGQAIWSGFPELRLWLLQVPNTAASRAIGFGAAMAGLLIAIRMWFSIESENFEDRAK